MVVIKEFRIPLPMTVEEYQVAQLFAVAEASKNETGGGEGIEVLKNEPFSGKPLLGDKYSSGQYTHKIYHLASKVPAFIRLLAPKGALEVHEKAWNAYPYCRTVVTNPDYMKESFYIVIESLHVPDSGQSENVHGLSPEELKQREVCIIDIANDPVPKNDYKKDEDPSIYQSEKTKRGPLRGNWMHSVSPVMCCYKLVRAEFKWWGLQSKVERFILQGEQRIFTNINRQVFCWTDRWHGLTMEDIRAIEDKTKHDLDELMKQGHVKGTTAD